MLLPTPRQAERLAELPPVIPARLVRRYDDRYSLKSLAPCPFCGYRHRLAASATAARVETVCRKTGERLTLVALCDN